MRLAMILALALSLSGASAAPSSARTTSVVTFGSETGIVFLDSRDSIAAYRLFELLNAPVETVGVRQTKIYAPNDAFFRITCSAVSADYACAVIVYRNPHAVLDFDTDHIELDLPAEFARRYRGAFLDAPDNFHFETEDGRLLIDWSVERLHIRYERSTPG